MGDDIWCTCKPSWRRREGKRNADAASLHFIIKYMWMNCVSFDVFLPQWHRTTTSPSQEFPNIRITIRLSATPSAFFSWLWIHRLVCHHVRLHLFTHWRMHSTQKLHCRAAKSRDKTVAPTEQMMDQWRPFAATPVTCDICPNMSMCRACWHGPCMGPWDNAVATFDKKSLACMRISSSLSFKASSSSIVGHVGMCQVWTFDPFHCSLDQSKTDFAIMSMPTCCVNPALPGTKMMTVFFVLAPICEMTGLHPLSMAWNNSSCDKKLWVPISSALKICLATKGAGPFFKKLQHFSQISDCTTFWMPHVKFVIFCGCNLLRLFQVVANANQTLTFAKKLWGAIRGMGWTCHLWQGLHKHGTIANDCNALWHFVNHCNGLQSCTVLTFVWNRTISNNCEEMQNIFHVSKNSSSLPSRLMGGQRVCPIPHGIPIGLWPRTCVMVPFFTLTTNNKKVKHDHHCDDGWDNSWQWFVPTFVLTHSCSLQWLMQNWKTLIHWQSWLPQQELSSMSHDPCVGWKNFLMLQWMCGDVLITHEKHLQKCSFFDMKIAFVWLVNQIIFWLQMGLAQKLHGIHTELMSAIFSCRTMIFSTHFQCHNAPTLQQFLWKMIVVAKRLDVGELVQKPPVWIWICFFQSHFQWTIQLLRFFHSGICAQMKHLGDSFLC